MSNITEDRPDEKPQTSKHIAKWLFRSGVLFFILIPGGLLKNLHQEFTEKTVTRDIVRPVHVAPAGGFRLYAVVDTEISFDPLTAYLTAAKGTPLVIEEHAWNDRYVCVAHKTLCVPTAPVMVELPRVGAKP